MNINVWYNNNVEKDVQFHLFDEQTTEYDVAEANPDIVFDQMAEAVLIWLTRNGVKEDDYAEFIPRILGTNLRVGSKSYNKVVKKIKKILEKT